MLQKAYLNLLKLWVKTVIIRLYHKEESTLTRLSVFWGSFLFVFSIFEEWLGKVKEFREKAILRKGGV